MRQKSQTTHNMTLDYNLESTEETLKRTADLCDKRVIKQGIFEAIYNRRLDYGDLVDIHLELQTHIASTKTEYYRLERFSRVFNTLFATNYNKVFNITKLLFNRMRSTMSGYRKTHKNFCVTVRKKAPYKDGKEYHPSFYERSLLNHPHYFGDPLTNEVIPSIVNEICNAIEEFFNLVRQSSCLCLYVIREERRILSDPEMLIKIFQNQYDKIAVNQRNVIVGGAKIKPQGAIKHMIEKQARSFLDFLREEFHNKNVSEMTAFVTVMESKKSAEDKNMTRARHMFGDDINKINRIIYVIKNFDSFLKLTPKAKNIPVETLSAFMLWCFGEKSTDRMTPKFMKFFKEFYKGKYVIPKDASVQSKLANLKDNYRKEFYAFITTIENCKMKTKAA